MDFGVAISGGIAFLTTFLFGLSTVILGTLGGFKSRTAVRFFGFCEIVGGLILLLGSLLCMADSLGEALWIQSSIAVTIILMFLALGHLIEIRKFLAEPTFIVLFGIANLKALYFLSIPLEANW